MLLNARFAAVVALAGLLGASPEPSAGPNTAPPAGSGDAAYAALAKDYFNESFRAAPVSATATGIHDYDAQLGSYGAADYAAQIARDHRYLDRLDGIDPGSLSRRIALDRQMLENALHDDLLLNETMQVWKHQPDGYVQTASGGIFVLISRNFAPPAVRLRDAIAREEQIPRLLAQARANLSAVDKNTASIAAEDAAGGVDLLTKTVPQAFRGTGDAATQARFRRSTAAAAAAMRSFASYLKTRWVAHPSGTFAIGAANYSARLKYEEGIEIPLDRYLAIGQKAFDETHAAMVATAKKIDPHASTEQVLARLYKVHPDSAHLLGAAQGDLVKLRAFVIAHHIIDLPPDADIKVTATPEFLRATTEASMDAPGPLERVATQAYYNVTPVDPHDPPKVQEQYLEAFNDYERPIISAHEVYPGHFVNFTIDKHLPLTLSEKLLTATSFVEGWAHYDEQMVVDEGWGNGDPRVRLMQLREAIWRNARFVAGVKMHTQGMTVAQAEKLFREGAFLDPASARAEAKRGTQDATYGYYTLGKMEILKLRADYKKKMGSAYTLARFHHDLLQYGDPAIPLLRPLLLGADDDGKILPD
ncbi:MAG TPA: DUF885 domain-containing protein [Candidatus Elarobacter sp.]|jgi:uncharacterized protein (DUF885 family)|nr:DUF885 domain-containing protein [Candidatus Elarobacter sp.]